MLSLPLCLLLAALPAAAADPAKEKLVLEIVLKKLLTRAPFIDETSKLPTAKELDHPPPIDIKVKAAYLASARDAAFDCDTGELSPGCHPVQAVVCGGVEGEKGARGVVVLGNYVWQLARKEGKFSEDRLAWILGHELGHIRLAHKAQSQILVQQLYEKWFKAGGKGAALTKRFRDRVAARFKNDPDAVDEQVHDALREAFLDDRIEEINAWLRPKEAEADEYAYTIARSAGFSPEHAHGLFRDWGADGRLLASKLDPKLPECEKSLGRRSAKSSSHPSHAERDDRLFERFFDER